MTKFAAFLYLYIQKELHLWIQLNYNPAKWQFNPDKRGVDLSALGQVPESNK